MAWFLWESPYSIEELYARFDPKDAEFEFEQMQPRYIRLRARPEWPPLYYGAGNGAVFVKTKGQGFEEPYLGLFFKEGQGCCTVKGVLSRRPSRSDRLLEKMDDIAGVPHKEFRGKLK